MSIEQLKKILESERNEMANRAWGFEGTSIREAGYYKRGHEAATNRLLPLLEKAVETITTLGEKHPDCFCMDREAISKEFLLSLSETTESVSELTKMVEIKKESGK